MVMKNICNFFIIFLISIGLIGCASKKQKETITKVVNNAEIEKQLVETARSIERSLALLAMTQEANNPPLLNTAPLVTPEGGMGITATIDWSGPLGSLVKRIADMTDYKVKILGNEPQIPIIVSITQNKAIVADLLKNASLQAGKRANIIVFPANRIIEIRYRSG